MWFGLYSMIVAASDDNLMKDSSSTSEVFLAHITRHFALIFASPAPRSVASEAKQMEPTVFLDALVDVLCEGNYYESSRVELYITTHIQF
jgi:hypothetical protein